MNDDDARCGERERAIRNVRARIAAAAAVQQAAQPVPAPRPGPPPAQVGPTLRPPPAWEQSPAPLPKPAPPPSAGLVAQAPVVIKNTAPMPALSPEAPANGAAAPFRPPPPPRSAAPRTVQSRVPGLGSTTPVGDDSIEKAVAAILPRLSLPTFTLRQFASLCAELACKPDRRSQTLERYGVDDEAVLTALDAHWRGERAARPEARTAFADDYASYLAWLHRHWV